MKVMFGEDHEIFNLILLSLAVFRLFLELVGPDFSKLPSAKLLGEKKAEQFHKWGLFFACGHILFNAPQYLF